MRSKNLKSILGVVVLSTLFLATSCNNSKITNNNISGGNQNNNSTTVEIETDNETLVTVDESVNDGDFSIVTEDGSYTKDSDIYTITKGGTYTLSGVLNGQIVVCVTECNSDGVFDVVLELNGLTITNDFAAPIYALESTDENINYNLEISAKKDTTNIVKDLRSDNVDPEDGAAIYSLVDLKLKGKGILYVSSSYNGIHTKDDLEIKNLTLSVTAKNNALKGNDSVTIESGFLTIISTGGDGIKTTNSGLNSKSEQKGNINIIGGEITIYSACDGIDAKANVLISDTADIEIYTSNYSSYSSEIVNEATDSLYLRVSNKYSNYRYAAYFYDNDGNYVWKEATIKSNSGSYLYYTLDIPNGYNNVVFYQFQSSQTENSLSTYYAKSNEQTLNTAYDMVTLKYSNGGLQTSYGVYQTSNQSGGFGQFGPGGMGMQEGNADKAEYSAKGIKASNEIIISGGSVSISAYDDAIHANNEEVIEATNSNGLGNVTISGGSITILASDDGIHADNTITISDSAVVSVKSAYEGIEANQIYFNGGTTYVYAKDDAINAASCGVSTTPCLYINSGYIDLDCASGDTDTIDSNGNIKMTGGYLVVKNRQSQSSSMSGGTIDLDGSFSMTGGILISFGTWCNEVSITATKSSTSSVSAGTYNLLDSSGNTLLSTTLETNYAGYRIISKLSGSYKLYNGSTLVTSF